MPTIVITGASQGIGAALAEAFAQEPNARLALLARNETKLHAVAEACHAHEAETLVLPTDVTDEAAVQAATQAVLERWGAPDVLINNAGVFKPGNVVDSPVVLFREQIEVNLTSAFMVTQAFLGAMTEAKRGTIFYMASVASIRAYAGGAAYCAAKHGLLGLARVVREETKEHGIRVTTLLPGATLTPSWDGVDLPEERFMPATDIAQAVRDAWHLSDRTVIEELLLRPQLGDI